MSVSWFRRGHENRWRLWVYVVVLLASAGLALPAEAEAVNADHEARSADAIAQLARVAGASGTLVHTMQTERGRGLIYENDGSPAAGATLRQARLAVDAAVRAWGDTTERTAPRANNQLVATVRQQLAGLPAERALVSARTGVPMAHIAWFTRLIAGLIAVASDDTGRVERAGIPYARLYVSLLVVTEQMGQERVEIANLLQTRTAGSRAGALDVVARRAVRLQGLQLFAALSPPAEAQVLAKVAVQPSARFVATIEQAIVDQNTARLDGLAATTWFAQATALLDQYNNLMVAHHAQVQARADRAAAHAHAKVRWATVVAIASLIAALALALGLMLIARRRIAAASRRALSQAEDDAARIDAVLSTASDAIIWMNEQAEIESANPATVKLYGYTPAELIGQSALMLIPPEARALLEGRLKDYYERAGENFIGTPREAVGQRKDGSQFPLEVLTARRTIGGRVLTTSIIRDISERKAVLDELTRRGAELSARNEALARSNAELQQFAYVASHDLQEPLRKVTSYVEVLEADYGDRLDDQAREYMRLATGAAQRMRHLINDLLALSRIREEGMEVGECDTRAVVDAIVDDFDVALREAGAMVDVGDLPFIPGDAVHLHQVFQNLISNAVKYHGAAPLLVKIWAQEVPQGWQFSVQDNGIGFPQEYAGQIFGMFKRLVSRRDYEGTGIGLAIVEKVIANHGGRIWATSEPGVGTTMSFVLPLRRVTTALPVAPGASPAPGVPQPRSDDHEKASQ